ncbi:Kelch-like protein 21 like protein [Argiope bruennichi]|uniref:Kelch-like protein 21 like protein n=1 Tax=Argiope bruennichi TaxID=94029 RepID=A0A8T0EUN5_ARGBR|nr:Kelch-like protein 21 like protein [Argiope bruennichi]
MSNLILKRYWKNLFLQYVSPFENGLALDYAIDEEVEEYHKTFRFSFLQYSNIYTKTEKSAPTAVEALEYVYRSASYVDVILKPSTDEFPAHKAILCARSPVFKSTVETNFSNIKFYYFKEDSYEQLLNFLYTDRVQLLSVEDTLPLFHLAATLNVKPLETKCILFLKDRLNLVNIMDTLLQAHLLEHRTLMSVVEDFILNNYALILGWSKFRRITDLCLELRQYIMLVKYKKDKTRRVQQWLIPKQRFRMVNMDGYRDKGFVFHWSIKNFNFCWHKTGEHLESPLLTVETPYPTFWRLWLYPRGEDDGEYISYYLCRQKGGPDVVSVDFELCLYVENRVVEESIISSKIYSFKCSQREGLKCFLPRWRVFTPVAAKNDRFTLTAGCAIFHVDNNTSDQIDIFSETTVIATYSISGIEVSETDSNLEPEITKDIEVKPLLKEEPLLNINASYFKKCLVVNIHPKNCKKIKYAVLKISIFQPWSNESPIQHIRTWIGEIKNIWKYYIPQSESVTPGDEKSFLLCYDFAFSTGDSVTDKVRASFYLPDWKAINLNDSKYSSRSALNALQDIYRSHSYMDLAVITETGCFPVHKAFLFARTSNDSGNSLYRKTKGNISEKFFLFLYTDTLEKVSWYDIRDLHLLSDTFNVEILKAKCAIYLKSKLDIDIAAAVLNSAENCNDLPLKNFVIDYIITYSEDIFPTSEWRKFSKLKPELSMQLMLLKYKRPRIRF